MKIGQLISSVRDVFRPKAQMGSGGRWYEPMLVETPGTSGQVVTPRSAMRHPIVFQCVNIIAGDVGQIPIVKKIRREEFLIERDRGHWLDQLLNIGPNTLQTASVWKENVIRDALLWGNHVSVIVPGDATQVELLPLNPANTWYEWDTRLQMYFIRSTLSGDSWKIPYDQVVHVRHLPGDASSTQGGTGFWGVDVVRLLSETIGHGLNLIDHGNALFSNNATPNGVLSSDQPWNKQAAENLRAEWNQIHGGARNAGKIAVLWENLQYKPISMSNKDAELVELKINDRQMIASIFNLPAWKVNGWENSSTRANVEETQREYFQSVLQRWLNRIREELERKLFLPSQLRTDRTWLEWEINEFITPDTKTRYEIGAIGVTNRLISPNEFRKQEGMAPYAGGDEYANPQPGGAGQAESNGEAAEQTDESDAETQEALEAMLRQQIELILAYDVQQLQWAGENAANFVAFLDSHREKRLTRAQQLLAGPCLAAERLGYSLDYQAAIENYAEQFHEHWLSVADAVVDQRGLSAITAKADQILLPKTQPIVSNLMEPDRCQRIFISTT